MRTFLFELWEGLLIALRAISANKLRSLLTTIGIVIGIVSVTAMFTTINGIERAFDRSMAMLGTNTLYVQRQPWIISGPREWMKYRSRPDIRADLAEAIEKRSRYALGVVPQLETGRPVSYRGSTLSGVYIQASTPNLAQLEEIDIEAGRYYTDFDTRTARAVAVIGAEVVEKLFPNEEPIGKHIRIDGHRFEVIGVLGRQGKFLGMFSFDEQVQMPINTFTRLFGGHRSYTIMVKVPSEDLMDEAEDELTGIVRAARGVDAMEEDNFSINRQEAFRQALAGFKVTIYGVGLFLTALALLVGGIGVMNIMFVSVKERTKEIGIRKAVGAPRRAVLFQFLIEAVIVCVIAGAIGLLLSFGITAIINSFFTAYLSAGTAMLAFGICVGVGVFFGFIPAWQAARAKPIDALRYE